jgi:hypothetical protein
MPPESGPLSEPSSPESSALGFDPLDVLPSEVVVGPGSTSGTGSGSGGVIGGSGSRSLAEIAIAIVTALADAHGPLLRVREREPVTK